MKVVLLLCFVTPLIVALHVDQNHYFTLLNVTAFMLNKTNCWICGAQIEHGKQGYALTTTQFYWDNETSEFNINHLLTGHLNHLRSRSNFQLSALSHFEC